MLAESARTPPGVVSEYGLEDVLLSAQQSLVPEPVTVASQGTDALGLFLGHASGGLLWATAVWMAGLGAFVLVENNYRHLISTPPGSDRLLAADQHRFRCAPWVVLYLGGGFALASMDARLSVAVFLLVLVVALSEQLAQIRLASRDWLLTRFRECDDEHQARLRAEAALAGALRADRNKTRFLALASHDLRQPIHAVGLFVAALRAERLDPQPRHLVEQLARSLEGLDELLNRLLDISRLDSGAVEPTISAVPAVQIARTLEARFARMAAERQLRFRIHVSPGLILQTDRDLLVEALTNLLSNALRCTSRGGVLLAFRGQAAKARIQVWDTGHGIPASDQARIFEEFVRLDTDGHDHNPNHSYNHGNGNGHCLGLGLAIVRRLALVLDHPLDVRSRIGQGSVFELQVPWTLPPALMAGQEVPGCNLGSTLAGVQVLIVEDDPVVLAAMCSLLASWGCYVLSASSVAQAVQVVSDAPRFPDLVITDFLLGERQTGEDVVTALRDIVPDPLPVIIVSARQRCALDARAHAMGWQFLEKPVNPNALGAAILKAVACPAATGSLSNETA